MPFLVKSSNPSDDLFVPGKQFAFGSANGANIIQVEKDGAYVNYVVLESVQQSTIQEAAGTSDIYSFVIDKDGVRVSIEATKMAPTMGGRRAAAAAAPKATAERVMVAGRKRVVYVGARGGRYIKKGDGYVSLRSLAA